MMHSLLPPPVTCHSLLPPRGTLSCLHVSSLLPLKPPRVTLSSLHVSPPGPGDTARGVAAFERATSDNIRHAQAHFNLGTVLLYLSRHAHSAVRPPSLVFSLRLFPPPDLAGLFSEGAEVIKLRIKAL